MIRTRVRFEFFDLCDSHWRAGVGQRDVIRRRQAAPDTYHLRY